MRQPINLIVAYKLCLKSTEISNNDIKLLFGVKADATAVKIKQPVLAEMAERNIFLPNGKIATNVAFDIWGLNEKDLERRYAKATKYNLR